MVFALAAAFLLEWRASQASAERLSEGLRLGLGDLGKQEDALGSHVINIIQSLRGAQDSSLLRIEARLREFANVKEAPPIVAQEGKAEKASPEEESSFSLTAAEIERLPALPSELDPSSALPAERLPDLVTQYRANPERRLDGLETARAFNIMAEARTRREVLQTRIQVATIEAAKTLKERGEFIEYGPGELYYSEPGIISYGEDLGDRGMRMFYLSPAEFPEIYAMREERERVPEIGARRLLALINKSSGG
jgi:hypothetical protein